MEWMRCREHRPPNEPGEIRVRVTEEILGLVMTPEWTTEMRLCGMGFGESEWWPNELCHWNGSRRRFIADYEWRPVLDGDPKGIIWHGLDMLDCPFTGKQPEVGYLGRWIGAPPNRAEWLSLRSHLVDRNGFIDAARMRDAWNQRVPQPQPAQ
ncbi:hypothetical protein [Salipiger mucosus]|uniref:Uncharacterized protein n=1 Tax=Salipiger mucosus DSM 16094 TaxID=1123237 RepID=S9SEP5_9RHOB|nr:hypothetical protein [Salipiger mucosus]EPX84749.1 hypothetical protein Salmuc_01322 [Salipiger mucosus DSM 16094]